jgi:hypothetical protein
MQGKKIATLVILGALGLASVFGVVAYRAASAQASTPTAPAASAANGAQPWGGDPRGGPGGYSNADLATALGITTDQLNTAYQTAYSEAIKQAVSQGLITQAQADQITANGSAFPFDGHWGGFLSQNGIDFDALLANALGISVDKLQAAYLQAFNARIDAVVAAGTMIQAQADLEKGEYALRSNKAFQSTMQTAYQNAVNQAVTDGVITQAQADAILKNATSQSWGGVIGMGGPGGFGGGPGRGHGGGPMGGPAGGTSSSNTQTAPTTTP